MKKYYLRNRLCFPVKGINRGVIYDLTRHDYHFIPISIYEIISNDDVITFSDEPYVKEWEDLLIEKEIIFKVKSPEEQSFFPTVQTEFDAPRILNNIIIHDNLSLDQINYLQSLDLLNISVILDTYNSKKAEETKVFLEALSSLEVDSIYVYIKDGNKTFKREDFKPLEEINQLFNIYLFNSNIEHNDEFDIINVIGLPYSFNEFSGLMNQEKLQVNYPHFFEAHNSHNYFNKKLYIDKDGNLKNGLNSTNTFGNINAITKPVFIDTIKSKSFQEKWNVKKEETLTCKDCEFRFMCVDPREPFLNKKGEWYHKTECNYNPYISKWTTDDNYKTLEECGVEINKDEELTINNEKMNMVFNAIWES